MRAWDTLFGIFVLFPLLTGGIWLRGDGYKIEYTQPGIGMFLLAAWAFLLWYRGRNPLQESWVLRTLHSLWRHWKHALATHEWRTLLLVSSFFSLIWFLAGAARHYGLHSDAADMGIFTNGIWNLTQMGWPYASVKSGISLLADHQIFLHYPISWIFPLWPSPYFLLLLQAMGLSLGAVALYLLGKQRLGLQPIVAMLPLVYWAYAPMRAATVFDFHPEVLLLPLFLFASWGLQASSWEKKLLGFFFFLLGMLAKESGGPVACGLGLAWLAGAGPEHSRRFTRVFGAFAVAMGVFWFWFDTQWIPRYFQVPYGYSDVYAPFGTSLTGILLAPFEQTQTFFSRLGHISRWNFLWATLAPLALLPLLHLRGLIASLPGYLMLFLTLGTHRVAVGFHYAIEPVTGLFFALPGALATPFAQRHQKKFLLLLPLAAVLLYGRSEPFHWRFYQITDHQAAVRDQWLPQIPRERSVSANSRLVPHLSLRQWIQFLPILKKDDDTVVDCVVWEKSLSQVPMEEKHILQLEKDLAKDYVLEASCASLAVFRRTDAPNCLAKIPSCP